MISRATVIWFVLVVGFSAGIWYDSYQTDAPCRAWKAAHPGVDPKTDKGSVERQPDGTYEISFNPCTVFWREMPLWVKLCALGWLVSLVGFVQSLVRDIVRFWRRRSVGVTQA